MVAEWQYLFPSFSVVFILNSTCDMNMKRPTTWRLSDMTGRKFDSDMRHGHFLNSTQDISKIKLNVATMTDDIAIS